MGSTPNRAIQILRFVYIYGELTLMTSSILISHHHLHFVLLSKIYPEQYNLIDSSFHYSLDHVMSAVGGGINVGLSQRFSRDKEAIPLCGHSLTKSESFSPQFESGGDVWNYMLWCTSHKFKQFQSCILLCMKIEVDIEHLPPLYVPCAESDTFYQHIHKRVMASDFGHLLETTWDENQRVGPSLVIIKVWRCSPSTELYATQHQYKWKFEILDDWTHFGWLEPTIITTHEEQSHLLDTKSP